MRVVCVGMGLRNRGRRIEIVVRGEIEVVRGPFCRIL